MANNQLIDVQNLSVHYPKRQVLKDIQLSLYEKTTYALLGPSGCGKTTLLYALAGLLPETCRIQGRCQSKDDLKLSTVLQDFGLFPWKTVLENTLLPLIIQYKKPQHIPGQSRKRALDILHTLNLDQHLEHFPATLSGGQKQRVAIARSWLMSPDLLLLDEPFSSLDALTRETLQETLLDLYQETEMSMFIVTHSIEEAVTLGKIIYVMNHEGQIVEQIKNSSFGLTNPRDTEIYFKQCLSIRKILKELRYEKIPMDL